jgi:ornithine cyclodeaminase/alanine dehydrogenase-like protein (mu-crystallin family)
VAQVRPEDFGYDFEQASHNGELVHAVKAGVLERDQVTELGDVLPATHRA